MFDIFNIYAQNIDRVCTNYIKWGLRRYTLRGHVFLGPELQCFLKVKEDLISAWENMHFRYSEVIFFGSVM